MLEQISSEEINEMLIKTARYFNSAESKQDTETQTNLVPNKNKNQIIQKRLDVMEMEKS